MSLELTDTNASRISAALIAERRKAGSPLMGMVMTFVVVADEAESYDAIRHARSVSREHPARILAVIRRGSGRGKANLDAEISIGGSGESVLLRMSGELTAHAESVVLPLLLPDSPVVAWWPGKAPDDVASDALGGLAQRRITDSGSLDRGRSQALLTQARNYTQGNTDMSWTRLTPWRALLSAALDQYPAAVHSAIVEAERSNPSADLLVAWLADRLHVEVSRTLSKGPGITAVIMETGGGPIAITRPDGMLAQFTIPNSPDRPVALKRRDISELLAEELRRLDPDDIYAATVTKLCRLADRSNGTGKRSGAGRASGDSLVTTTKATGARARRQAKETATAPTSAAALAKATAPSETKTARSTRPAAKRAAKVSGSAAGGAKATTRSATKASSKAVTRSATKAASKASKQPATKRAGSARASASSTRKA